MTARNNGLPASEKKKRAGSIAKHISFTGVFAALCFVATVIVKIPPTLGRIFQPRRCVRTPLGLVPRSRLRRRCRRPGLRFGGPRARRRDLCTRHPRHQSRHGCPRLFYRQTVQKIYQKGKVRRASPYPLRNRRRSRHGGRLLLLRSGMPRPRIRGCRGNREQRPSRLGRAVRLRASGGSAVSPAPRPQLLSEARLKIRDKNRQSTRLAYPVLFFIL